MLKPVDRAAAFQRFELANRLVSEGQNRVERQLALIARLAREGHDTLRARTLLSQFEATLALQVATRDRIAEGLREEGEPDLGR